MKDFKGTIDNAREERGDILVPNEVLDAILLYLPELLRVSSELLGELDARVELYEQNQVPTEFVTKVLYSRTDSQSTSQ